MLLSLVLVLSLLLLWLFCYMRSTLSTFYLCELSKVFSMWSITRMCNFSSNVCTASFKRRAIDSKTSFHSKKNKRQYILETFWMTMPPHSMYNEFFGVLKYLEIHKSRNFHHPLLGCQRGLCRMMGEDILSLQVSGS